MVHTLHHSFAHPFAQTRGRFRYIQALPGKTTAMYTHLTMKEMGALKAHWIFWIYKMWAVCLLPHFRN
jgi:site-specific recombinase XerC